VSGVEAIRVTLDSSVVKSVANDVVVVDVSDVLVSVSKTVGTLEISKEMAVVVSVDKIKDDEYIVVVSKELTMLYDVTVETHESTM
jgi:hypothetical protein